MSWEEKVVGLNPLMVTAVFFLPAALSALLLELFPIGSWLAWVAFALAAAISLGATMIWTGALHKVALSRTRVARADFQSVLFWLAAWCALCASAPNLPRFAWFIAPIVVFMTGFSYIRAISRTTKALESFEPSQSSFWTFVQILYFPIGVWYLYPRLRRLLAAPQHAALSST
jgi:hypothetical protein